MIKINGSNLDLHSFEEVVFNKEKVGLSEEAIERVKRSREYLERRVKGGDVIYGVNTGVGKLAFIRLNDSDLEEFQVRLLDSHAVGVGNYLGVEEVRGAMLLRANTLAKGFSGVRVEVINKLIEFLNEDIIPLVPEKGSVGASGDLVPLAHIALALTGKGEVFYKGKRKKTEEVLNQIGIKPLKLSYKEALALINGTQVGCAILALNLIEAYKIVEVADKVASLTIEALLGITKAFDLKICEVRKFDGQRVVCEDLLRYLKDSKLATQGKEYKVQDAYSLRCVPQVHGAVRDTLEFVKKIVEIEMNSATDNPLVFPDYGVISCGNFHGEYVSLASDYLSIALTVLGQISERRLYRMLDPSLSEGLPAFLVKNSGLNSGFMMLQVMVASLSSQNAQMSMPSSVFSLPTSAGQEDFVSMSQNSVLKLKEIIKNLKIILSIEAIAALQGIELRGLEKSSSFAQKIHSKIRKIVPFLEDDFEWREYLKNIENIFKILSSQEFH